MNKGGWVGKVLLVLAVLAPALGLALSIYLSRTDQAPEAFSSGQDGAEYVLTSADFPEVSEIGNQVGDRMPDFTLELADGGTVTAAGLVAEGQPTFLFFWATI